MSKFTNEKGIAHLLVVGLLLVGIVVGLILIKSPQTFRPRAASNPVSGPITPSTAPSPTPVITPMVPLPSPVAYWEFDETSGTTVSDKSGNNNNGTWSGSGQHWVTGVNGIGVRHSLTVVTIT
jgi:hypothetical protein